MNGASFRAVPRTTTLVEGRSRRLIGAKVPRRNVQHFFAGGGRRQFAFRGGGFVGLSSNHG